MTLENSRRSKETLLINLISIAIFISNISQLPQFHGNNILKYTIIFLWLIMSAYIILSYYGSLIINKSIRFIIINLLAFDVFILTAQILTGRDYILSNFIYPVHLCIAILIVSYFIGQIIEKEDIKKILKAYVISSLIVGISIYLETFKGTDWLNSAGYMYTSKNSVSIIFLISIIILYVFLKENKIIQKICVLFFVLILFMLKSRATIVGGVLAIMYYIFLGEEHINKRIVLIVTSLSFISIIMINDNLYDFFINKIMLNNSENANLNMISSGRINHIIVFKEYFKYHMLVGYGSYYLEAFPLAALMSYGIIGFIPLFIISTSPLYITFKYKKYKHINKMRIMMIMLGIVMISNGLFEELAPFGPGVKCYMVWLVLGIYLGQVTKEIKNERRINGK